ncbi:MAG: YafY family transcriptional regulator [Chitinophagaceae bacterium]|nr:MAG: YafY family transcriptional regulator [Chitinophagaceae bacterium]
MGDEVKNRFDRIVAILTQLQTSRVVRAQELADRFQVSLRTIYRDIRSLEEAGVPVSGEAGVGYSLMDGYRLPPVMFTQEEASSFVAAEKLMQKFTDKKVAADYGAAMSKIRSVLRGNLKDHVDALDTQIWMNPADENGTEPIPGSLGILLESIAQKKQVRIEYRAFESEHASMRDIEPVGLFHAENNWNMMAYCHLRNDYRQFRADRILKIARLDMPFTREHPSIDVFRKTEWPGTNYRVVIRVAKDVCKYLRAGKKYYGIVDEKIIGDQIEMTFMTHEDGEGLARWFMMFGDNGEVVEPQDFRDKITAFAREIISRNT